MKAILRASVVIPSAILLVGLALWQLCLCRGRPHPHKGCDLAGKTFVQNCPSGDCGGNSPIINGFPINGLHPDGCFNADDQALIPESLDVHAASLCEGEAMRLDVMGDLEHGYELVAKNAAKTCKGAELVGAFFDVWTPRGKVRLVISHVGYVQMNVVVVGDTPPPPKRVGYLFTLAVDPTTSVCAAGLPETAYGATDGVHGVVAEIDKATLYDTWPDDFGDYAIILPGPIYNRKAQEIDNTKSGWFNIACDGDALAKSDLSGLVPRHERETVLHMFAAQYKDGFSATMRGVPIEWEETNGSRSSKDAGDLPVEAHWNKNGASCLEHSRLWIENRLVPALRFPHGEYTPDYANPRCKGDLKCEKEVVVMYYGDGQERPCPVVNVPKGTLMTHVWDHVHDVRLHAPPAP